MSLKLNSIREWIKYRKENKKIDNMINKIPRNCNTYYKNEWCSWTDFLGSILKSSDKQKIFPTYDELYNYTRNNLFFIKNSRQWKKYVKENKLENIPINPQEKYKKCGWIDWYVFLNKEK